MSSLLKKISKRFLSLLLVGTILAPWPYVLVIPQYAFAKDPIVSSSSGNGVSSSGGTVTTWGQAAASGAVSLGACLAAGNLTLAGAYSTAKGFISGVYDSIFGGSGLVGAGAKPSLLTSVAGVGGKPPTVGTAGGAAGGGLVVPVIALATDALLTAGNQSRDTIGAAQTAIQSEIARIQLGIAMKKDVFDCIGWAIAKMIWRHIAASIIDWINGGFNGKPAFIQNFDRFLLGIADNIAGEVIQGAGLGFLCSPFQLNIRIALATRYAQSAPSCTLTQVIANIEDFMQSFQNGGWGAWLQFTTAPQNNAYGGYLLGEATIAIRTRDAQSQQSQQLSWGSGFLSLTQQTCKNVPVSINGMKPQMVEQCTSSIQTPGELIAHKLGSTIDAPELSLIMADDLNKIIDALSQQLIMSALTGLFSLSQPKSYGDDYYRFGTPTTELSQQDTSGSDFSGSGLTGNVPGSDALIAQIDATIQKEETLQSKVREALQLIDDSIQNDKTVKACWDDKANPSSSSPLSSEDRTQAGIQAQVQTSNLVSLGNKRKPFSDGYDQSVAVAASLQDLISQVASAQTAEELAALSADFYSKQTSGVYTTAADLDRMDQILVQSRADASVLYQNAVLDSNICHAFPDPLPSDTTQQ